MRPGACYPKHRPCGMEKPASAPPVVRSRCTPTDTAGLLDIAGCRRHRRPMPRHTPCRDMVPSLLPEELKRYANLSRWFSSLDMFSAFTCHGTSAPTTLPIPWPRPLAPKPLPSVKPFFIAGILNCVGAIFIGAHVTNTIRKGIVSTDVLADPHLALIGALSALLAAALWVSFATWKSLPVSTTHSHCGRHDRFRHHGRWQLARH